MKLLDITEHDMHKLYSQDRLAIWDLEPQKKRHVNKFHSAMPSGGRHRLDLVYQRSDKGKQGFARSHMHIPSTPDVVVVEWLLKLETVTPDVSTCRRASYLDYSS